MSAAPQSGSGKAAPKNRRAEISPARKAAFDILTAVERGHAHSDELLRGNAVNALSAPDRNLATALVLGVLRWQIRLDHLLQRLLKHPNARLDGSVLIALRIGAFQLLHMDRIPARAAIDESVELAKQAGHRFASAMVNAVLRKLSSAAQVNFVAGNAAELALAEAHPAWMVERWASFYGLEAARTICRHGQSQPVLTIRIADEKAAAGIAQAGIEFMAGRLLTAARIAHSTHAAAWMAMHEGSARMQDEGSQLIGELAAGSLNREVKHILDACAAPGGKTLILAERHPQARVLACESSAARLEHLRKRLGPLGERIECRLGDAAALAADAAFDLVLADVPCSGTGTLGRNPEIRHRLRPEDLPRQAERQRAILAAGLRAVRPGGRVVYSTCSLEPEENEEVVDAVLADAPGTRAISLQDTIESLQSNSILAPGAFSGLQAALTLQGALRLLPGAFDSDGFFIALIEREH